MTRHRCQSEQRSVTILVLGVCVMMLFVGGVAFDLWRAFSERRALAGVVDAAAVANASGIDTGLYRTTGNVRLDPTISEALAWDNLRRQEDTRSLVDATVDATSNDVTVTAAGQIDFNGKIRKVPVTGTIHRLLVRHRDGIAVSEVGGGVWPLGGEDGLLFPGPDGAPWDRSVWRRAVFIPSARTAGWEMVGDALTPTGSCGWPAPASLAEPPPSCRHVASNERCCGWCNIRRGVRTLSLLMGGGKLLTCRRARCGAPRWCRRPRAPRGTRPCTTH